jgi:dTDP-4-amino-4,6-dideoxygalactose transaminase
MINVTKPFLPPREEYIRLVHEIWDRNWLTNNGPLVNELELQLKKFLNLNHLLFTTNGTIALQIAIKALDLKGDILTTPFSYIATTSSIVWENCSPVFVDIEPDSLNIDPDKIEAAITPATCAILATHTYGNPCDVDRIGKIAEQHHLKVIYDAAHGFGTSVHGKSIYAYGDASCASFHATKLFHTIEGGALITADTGLLKKMAYMRNFGHHGPEHFAELGINGKNSEFHAAMGLVNLPYVAGIIRHRQHIWKRYQGWLEHIHGRTIKIAADTEYNYAYFPLILETEEALKKTMETLNAHWIYPRRYFFPSLNQLHYLARQDMPVCDELAKRVMCLPLYDTMKDEEVDFIARIILRAQNN